MARIQGTFIDFSRRTNHYQLPLEVGLDHWLTEMTDLRAAGIEDVIIARAMVFGRTHFLSDLFEEWLEADAIDQVMRAAHEHGLRVYLGLHLNMNLWNRSKDFARMMRRDLALNRALLHELMQRYRDHPALVGIYVPNEPDRDNIAEPDRTDAFRQFMHGLYLTIHHEYALPVLTSPFFSKSLPPAELARWWDQLLDRPMFDILAMQDGVGCRRDIMPEDVPAYYAPLAEVLQAHDVTFWNNVETFILPPTPQEHLTPAPMERIDRQYRAGAPFVARTITWEYGHFLGRQLTTPERYEQFRAWNLADNGSANATTVSATADTSERTSES